MTLTGFQVGAPGFGNISYGQYPSAGLPVTDWGAIAQSAQVPSNPYGSFGVDTAGAFDTVGRNLAGNPLNERRPGFIDYLNTFTDLIEGGADAFRAVKGLPARYAPERERRLAGDQFSKYLEDRRIEREQRRQERQDKMVSDDKAFNLNILRKALSSPDALRQLFGENIVSPSIDPSGLSAEMDTTAAPRWRPQTPSSQP